MGYGDFTRTLPPTQAETDPLNVRIKNYLDDSMPDGPENAPAEEVRRWAEHFQSEDANLIKQRANADAFLALHKEFVDTNQNGQTMNRTLEALYGDRVYTVAEFEKAYAVCCANNSLQLDKAEIVKQQQHAEKERAKAERAKRAAETHVFSEAEKYNTLSLEELREAENREIKKQMQLAGERGGNGW